MKEEAKKPEMGAWIGGIDFSSEPLTSLLTNQKLDLSCKQGT